jgi:hypothetical protein
MKMGPYLPKSFKTDKQAADYGLEIGKYIIDAPPLSARPKKKQS